MERPGALGVRRPRPGHRKVHPRSDSLASVDTGGEMKDTALENVRKLQHAPCLHVKDQSSR